MWLTAHGLQDVVAAMCPAASATDVPLQGTEGQTM